MKVLFVNNSKQRRKFGDIKLNSGDAVVEVNGIKKWMKKGTFETVDIKEEVIVNEPSITEAKKVDEVITEPKTDEGTKVDEVEPQPEVVEEVVEPEVIVDEPVEEKPAKKKSTKKKKTKKEDK